MRAYSVADPIVDTYNFSTCRAFRKADLCLLFKNLFRDRRASKKISQERSKAADMWLVMMVGSSSINLLGWSLLHCRGRKESVL